MSKIVTSIISNIICPYISNGGLLTSFYMAFYPINILNMISFCCFYSMISNLKLGLLNSVSGEGKEFSKNRAFLFALLFHLLLVVPYYTFMLKTICSYM